MTIWFLIALNDKVLEQQLNYSLSDIIAPLRSGGIAAIAPDGIGHDGVSPAFTTGNPGRYPNTAPGQPTEAEPKCPLLL